MSKKTSITPSDFERVEEGLKIAMWGMVLLGIGQIVCFIGLLMQ